MADFVEILAGFTNIDFGSFDSSPHSLENNSIVQAKTAHNVHNVSDVYTCIVAVSVARRLLKSRLLVSHVLAATKMFLKQFFIIII